MPRENELKTAAIAAELERVGLTDKEVSAYLVLLRLGARSTTFIAKRAGLNRGTAYFALHSLLEKGLVTKSVRHKVQYFAPLEPRQLLSYLTRTEEQVRLQRTRIAELLPEIEALRTTSVARPKIEVLEGIEGARNAIEATLGCKDKVLRGFLSLVDIIDYVGEDFFDRYTALRISGGLQLRAIRSSQKDELAFDRHAASRKYRTSKKDRREVRYLDSSPGFPISTYIFDDCIAVVSSRDEDFSLLIRSPEMAAMRRTLFDLIWSGLGRS